MATSRLPGLAACLLLAAAVGAAGAETRLHGENSLFTSPQVKLAWAIRKGASEDITDIVIRVINIAGVYRHIRLDGVDPFSKDRAVLVEAMPLPTSADLVVPRAKFADHPSAEIRLFRTDEELGANTPDLTVFYLGVPDTTPEFASPGDADAHLTRMLRETR